MPKNVPSLKPRELIRLLENGGCAFYREGRGDHRLYVRTLLGKKRVVPIDMGSSEFSPAYVLRIMRQFGFMDEEIENLLFGSPYTHKESLKIDPLK
jgi:predicted RNA binding protein YcfA (HicA-like mRNA interferase family)